MWKCILGKRGIICSLTLVVYVLLIIISPGNVQKQQKSATMAIKATSNLKYGVSRDSIANSNITKALLTLVILIILILALLSVHVTEAANFLFEK